MTTPNTGETHEDSAVPTPPTEAGEEATTEVGRVVKERDWFFLDVATRDLVGKCLDMEG